MVAPAVREASCVRGGVREAGFPALSQPPLSIAAKPSASMANALLSLVPGLQARQLLPDDLLGFWQSKIREKSAREKQNHIQLQQREEMRLQQCEAM